MTSSMLDAQLETVQEEEEKKNPEEPQPRKFTRTSFSHQMNERAEEQALWEQTYNNGNESN